MGMVYLPMFTIKINPSCRDQYANPMDPLGPMETSPFVNVDDVMAARTPPRQTPRAAQSEVLGGREGKSRRFRSACELLLKAWLFIGDYTTQVYIYIYIYRDILGHIWILSFKVFCCFCPDPWGNDPISN